MARPGRPHKQKPPTSPLIEAFLDMLVAERGAALNTRQAYERDLAALSLFLAGRNAAPGTATTDELRSYFAPLAVQPGARRAPPAGRTLPRHPPAAQPVYRLLLSEGRGHADPSPPPSTPH